MTARSLDRRMLDIAARAALRAAGDVEPNPMVGCVLGRPDGTVLAIAHHARHGGPHAEANAIAEAARRGRDLRGATAWVTLEPCAHTGRTPPCVDALLRAGVSEVVIAKRDPNKVAAGGMETLAGAGVRVRLSDASELAIRVSDPFVTRVTRGRPFVVAKWAQTIDGRLATRTGDSKWISCEASRRRVHRLRARVDAVLTGAGTVIADDPRLTARGVARVRRVARRVVLDPSLRVSPDAQVLDASVAPTLVLTTDGAIAAHAPRVEAIRSRGAEVASLAEDGAGRLDLAAALCLLAERYDATNVLVEAGPNLLGALLRDDLIDEALVYTAPLVLGDSEGLPAAFVGKATRISDASRFTLRRVRRVNDDIEARYTRTRG